MILGVSHLTLGTIDLDRSVSEWEARGYKIQFKENEVPNDPAKKPLLYRYRPFHGLATLRSDESGFPIEAVQHGPSFAPGYGRYEFENGQLSLWTPELDQTREFWTNAFRFSESGSATLILRSPVPGWGCMMVLREKKGLEPGYLDSEGWTCLAFLSRDIDADTAKVEEHGAVEIAGPFSLMVDDKAIRVSIFRSPTGECCELVQIEGKK